MIFRIFLSIALLGLVFYALASRRRRSIPGRILGLISLVGVVFVWKPDWSTAVANALGIGRGADLVIYCCIIAGLFLSLNLYSRLAYQSGQLTELTRAFALQSPLHRASPSAEDGTHHVRQD